MIALYPLRFHPIYKEYMWGGRRFGPILGRDLAPDKIYAESWEIADHPQGRSTVAAGPLRGESLSDLIAGRGPAILGRHGPMPRFPLLLKYLDAQAPLSLQVHPDDRLAAEMGLSDPGKTEAWFVLDAQPGSLLWAGLAEPIDRATVEKALLRGEIERLLHRVEPSPGDCLLIPAGTVHALGAGLLVAEIQQMSDNTFRLSDWGRVGPDGKARQLHLEQGLRAIDYGRGPIEPTRGRPAGRPGVTRLAECDQFVLELWQLEEEGQIGGSGGCVIVTVVEGQIEIEGDVVPPLRLGETILLPACCGPLRISPLGAAAARFLAAQLP
ncbi:MAG: class I mannose-6-phosphate isomerase [Pirellulales bacterium]|jgi:mannose-6-phosphate isomerase|nr:class I mannose-6-phosphate isomerase [Thermoguttaceae bacterium]MDD4786134.1 class I mannose-6-phosphate isomerase [Pirellulales bacterium]MDI9446097.1 class I mannose-6-phosphate isomerase [Planctomycetota bacterium]NLZ02055.1 class I mannose-6-phosphate isomerase [Pirellulaceae bacterium]